MDHTHPASGPPVDPFRAATMSFHCSLVQLSLWGQKYAVFGCLQNGLGKRIIEQATLVITNRKPIYLVLFLMGSWVEGIWIWIPTLLLAAWPGASRLASLNPGYKGILWKKKLYRQSTKIATGTEHMLEGALFLSPLSLDRQSHTTDMESLVTSD